MNFLLKIDFILKVDLELTRDLLAVLEAEFWNLLEHLLISSNETCLALLHGTCLGTTS